MPRFVVLEHSPPRENARGLHWDFMLEFEVALKTWALPEPPTEGCALECPRLADHRLAYLDYEGPVSGDRGNVRRFDAGEYDLIAESAEELRFKLRGSRLNGAACLSLVCAENHRWRFTFDGA